MFEIGNIFYELICIPLKPYVKALKTHLTILERRLLVKVIKEKWGYNSGPSSKKTFAFIWNGRDSRALSPPGEEGGGYL
jgi:hypothetical protein